MDRELKTKEGKTIDLYALALAKREWLMEKVGILSFPISTVRLYPATVPFLNYSTHGAYRWAK